MNDLLVIFDLEITYARRLSEYISRTDYSGYDVRVCSSFENFRKLIEDKKIELLIIGEECTYELNGHNYELNGLANKVVVLSEDPYSQYTYRYQKASKILDYAQMSRNITNLVEKKTDLKLTLKSKVQEKLLVENKCSDEDTLRVIDSCIDSFEDISADDKKQLRNSVFYSIRGLDVLEELIADESITEIMVNGENRIFYEKEGKLTNSGMCFDSREQLIHVITKIVSFANRTVNMSNPIVDARLENGSRVNVVLEPVSLDGPALTIRRFPSTPLVVEDLLEIGAVTEEIIVLLRQLVYAGYNILISGGTGSGKTTFLNILTSFIPLDERIVTIEDSAELKILGIQNLVRLETRNASSSDGSNEISMRDLIKTALRMRPDRVIVGEVRGEEAIDMLQAFSVGLDGSMSTIHANNAEDALYRLEMLLMLGKIDMPLAAIRRQISIGVDIVIQLGRLKDKSRKLLEVREVLGIENTEIRTNLLFAYENGTFVRHGDIRNTYKLERAGII